MLQKTRLTDNCSEFKLLQKQLLEHFLRKNNLPNLNSNSKEWATTSGIEFIVRPECNQKCKYCYITNYGNKLYPLEERANKAQILSNLSAFLQFLLKNKMIAPEINLFAGDLFFDNFIYEIYDIIYDYYAQVPYHKEPYHILMPTNGRFLVEEQHQQLLRKYAKKFNEIGVVNHLSISTDGLYSVDAREQDNNINQEYYDKLFVFAKEMHYLFHPMISPENVDNWVRNLNWWKEMFEKHSLGRFKGDILPYQLEVRNDGWTKEKIEAFCYGLKKAWHMRLEALQGNAYEMAQHIFSTGGIENFNILTLSDRGGSKGDSHLACHVNNELIINLADMSIPFCHRTSYPQFTAGKFIIKDNEIVDLQTYDNMHSYMTLKLAKPILFPKCEKCRYRFVCMKGCFGAQYESSGEIFLPIESVCQLEQAKIDTLIELMNITSVLEEALYHNLINTDSTLYSFLISRSQELGYQING